MFLERQRLLLRYIHRIKRIAILALTHKPNSNSNSNPSVNPNPNSKSNPNPNNDLKINKE